MRFNENLLKLIFLSISLLILLVLYGCNSDPRKIEQRLEAFKNCIGPEATILFESGKDSACATLIEEKITSDISFRDRYEKMKASEAIDLFTPEEVVNYFREYFADVIEKEKSTR